MNQKVYTFSSVSSFSSKGDGFDVNSMITPTVLVYITLLSFILFVFVLLHLLIKFLLRPQTRLEDAYEESANDPQGRLQTPLNLHDSGVDKSFPLFHYKTLVDLKHDPFDCAVCLCEFEAEDELRILSKCSHAFHVNCIDTWLLTNSTCPLCRDNLLLSLTSSSSPVVILHESEGESSQDDRSKPENDERVVLHQVSGEAERLQ